MPQKSNPQNVRVAQKVNDIQGELRVDQYLTNFSESYRQDEANFVTPFASTPIPVNNESDKYAIFPAGYFWRDEAEVRPLGGRPVQVGYKVLNGQYLAEEWALEHTIDDRQRRNAASPYDLDESGVALLESKQLIRQDRIWTSKFFKSGVWTHDFVGGQDFEPWNDDASNPLQYVDNKKNEMALATGKMPNTMVIGANIAIVLKHHPDLVDRIKYSQRGVISMDLLASLFEVERLKVARAVYNAAEEGLDDDFEFIADPDSIWIGYIEPSARMNAPTAIARFAWTGLIPGAMNNTGGVITRGRDDRAYSDWIHSRNAFDLKLVSADLGMFFSNVNQAQSA